MKRIKRIFLISALIFVVLCLAGILLYHYFLDARVEDYLTLKIRQTLEDQFEREVSIGKIHLNFPNPQIIISDLAIARRQSLKEGVLLSAETTRAKVLLHSLISKRIVIDDIVLERPAIWIEFDEQGQSNLPSFVGKQQGPQKEPSRFQPGNIVERLYFPHIQIIDAQVYFAHKQIPLTVSVQRFSTTLSLSLERFLMKGNLSLQGGEFEFQDRGRIATTISGGIEFSSDTLAFSALTIQANTTRVQIDGTLHNITRPRLDLSVNTQLALEELDRFLRLDQNLTGMAAFDGTVTGQIPDITATGHLTCEEGTAWKLDFANVETDVTYRDLQVILNDLDVNMFDGRATGEGRLSFGKTSGYQASLRVEELNIENARRFVEDPLPLEGLVNGHIEVHSNSFAFEDLMLETDLNLVDIHAYGVNVPRGEAQVGIQEKTLSINNLRADVFEGIVAGDGSMELSPEPNYQVTLDTKDVHLESIMALIPQPPDISGPVSGKIQASGATFDLDTLKLEADLHGRDIKAYQINANTLQVAATIKDNILSLSEVSAGLFEGIIGAQGKLVLAGETLPKFDLSATLKELSTRALMQQFASNADTGDIAIDGNLSGEVAFHGNSYQLNDIRGSIGLQGFGDILVKERTVPFELQIQSSLHDSLVQIATGKLTSSALTLDSTGEINLNAPEVSLRYEVAAENVQTLFNQIFIFLPTLTETSPLARFSGNIASLRGTIQGPVAALQIQTEARLTNADVVWAKADEINADLLYENNILTIQSANVAYKSAQIKIKNGTIDLQTPETPSLELPVALTSGQLADYLALVKQAYPIEGDIKAVETTLRGPVDQLHTALTLEITQGTAWKQSFDSISGKLALADNQLRIDTLTMTKNGGKISLEGFLGFDLLFRAALRAENLNFRDIDAFEDIAVHYQGQADITLDLQGTLQAPEGKADIQLKNLVYRETPIEDVTCNIVLENQTLQTTLVTFRKKFITSFELGLTPELPYRMKMVMEQAAVEQILSLATTLEGISGLISGEITSDGTLQDLSTVSAAIKLRELQLDIFGQKVANSREIDVVVTPERLKVESLELKGKELGLFAQGELDFKGNFDLALDGIIDLRPIPGFLPKSSGVNALAGHLQLICNVRGTFLQPEIEGIVEITNGSLQLAAYPDPIRNIQGKLAFTQGKVELLKLQGDVSGGSFESSGEMTYQGMTPESFTVDIAGKNMTIQHLVEALTTTVSPRLRISGNLAQQNIVGEILVQEALYSKELDLQTLLPEKNRKLALTPLQKDGTVGLDIFIKAPQNIKIRNRLAELDLRANLRIQGTTANPQLEGRVDILKGKAQFGDITYRILSGVLDFADPLRINPEINIQVETLIQETAISLGIEGDLDQFTLDMRSDPELTKAQITRLLAAGSSNGANGYNFVTKPLQTLVEGQIEKAVRLDRFTVDVDPLLSKADGAEATPRVTLGKRLFSDLLLTYTTTVGGTERAQTVEIEYQLSDTLSLTARRDEKGEIDASFTFKFQLK